MRIPVANDTVPEVSEHFSVVLSMTTSLTGLLQTMRAHALRPAAGICRRGVTWTSNLYVCVGKHTKLGRGVWGMLLPRKFLEIRCSEIASGAVLGQKQSLAEYFIQFLAVHVSIC